MHKVQTTKKTAESASQRRKMLFPAPCINKCQRKDEPNLKEGRPRKYPILPSQDESNTDDGTPPISVNAPRKALRSTSRVPPEAITGYPHLHYYQQQPKHQLRNHWSLDRFRQHLWESLSLLHHHPPHSRSIHPGHPHPAPDPTILPGRH